MNDRGAAVGKKKARKRKLVAFHDRAPIDRRRAGRAASSRSAG